MMSSKLILVLQGAPFRGCFLKGHKKDGRKR